MNANIINILYWGSFVFALLLCIAYDVWICAKYHIKRWKAVLIALLYFISVLGAMYLSTFIEAGLRPYGSTNIVRTWVYVPLFTGACSLIFRINFKKLSDFLTPGLLLGNAFVRIGCVFAGCCHGYPYDGFGAIYNHQLHCYVFPIQMIEALYALVLFFVLVVYIVKTDFKITGRLYPLFLIAYTLRVIFEFFRDNRKILGPFSSLSFHAMFGGVVGAIWFFCTTATGKVCIAKARNAFRKALRKQPIPVLTKAEYSLQIKRMNDELTYPKDVCFPAEAQIIAQVITTHTFDSIIKEIRRRLHISLVVSNGVLFLCIVYLTLAYQIERVATFFVSLLAAFAAVLVIYSIIVLQKTTAIRFSKDRSKTAIYHKPHEEGLWLIHDNNVYSLNIGTCTECHKQLAIVGVDDKHIVLACKGKEKHFNKVSLSSLTGGQ